MRKITLRHEQKKYKETKDFCRIKKKTTNITGDIMESPFPNLCSKISESERNGELEMKWKEL